MHLSVGTAAVDMDVLADIVVPDLAVLFCGTAVPCAVTRGHFHAGRGDDFWRLLHDAGFTPTRLEPSDDETLPAHGCGLTDLVPRAADPAPGPGQAPGRRSGYDVVRLTQVVEAYRPRWVAFTSKTAGQAAARELGGRATRLGVADWRLATSEVFVLPSPSGANRRRDYDGRPSRLEWWRELRQLAVPERPPGS